ncbi:MAG: hypothetical protein IJJ99_04765 [Oscillospiraceae bacterium]|nr:hypothetical protein [Oscillospiraceae bacterium]
MTMNAKRIKTFLSVLLAVTILAACAGCGGSPSDAPASEPSAQNAETVKTAQVRPEQFDPDEYILYQNIFYQDYGKSYDGTAVTKNGVFALIYDAYSSRERYYVWGYYDQTRCCDWQWEFVPQDGASLPPVGSLVTVTGTFTYDENALDKYWIADAQIAPTTEYAGPSAERDMCSMSCTLERVQIYNVMYHGDVFEGQTFTAYGRVASPNTLEDPYYDNSWQIGFTWDGDVPAIGTLVELSGTIRAGQLDAQSLTAR